jgi:hypothetical protein
MTRSRWREEFAIPAFPMKARAFLRLSLALALVGRVATAAIPASSAASPAERTAADARAEQSLASPPRVPAATAAPTDGAVQVSELRREMVGQRNLVSARFEQVEAKLYELVGRLQLLTACLIALFLGVFVWQISLSRQIGELKAARRAATPVSGRLG